MKYLHVVSVFPGLTETFVYREVEMMRQLGCEVLIGQLRPVGTSPTAASFENLRPFVVPARLMSSSTIQGLAFFILTKPRRFSQFIRLLFRAFPDILSFLKLAYILVASVELSYALRHAGIEYVHAHHFHSEASAAMFISGFLGIPYGVKVYTVKIDYPSTFMKEVICRANIIIADTFQVRHFLRRLGADLEGIHVLRNSIVLDEIPMRAEEPASRTPVILAVGRMDHKKGFHILLDACSILRANGDSFRCVIVGDGREWGRLRTKRQQLGLESHVELVGRLSFPEVQQWYDRAAILAVPSVVSPDGATDGLPTVIIEAFARGVPVVASATAGIPEVINNGDNGFLVRPGSMDELAIRIKELLESKDLRRAFASNGRRTAEEDFDLSRTAHTLLEIILKKRGSLFTDSTLRQPSGIHTILPEKN